MPQPIARPDVRTQHRHDHRRVAGTVVVHADQRFDDAAALHLVIVLPDDPFLAAHVGRGQDLQQGCGEIVLTPSETR